MNTIDNLAEVLEKLYQSDHPTEDRYFCDGGLADEAVNMANELLIAQGGGCNWSAIDELRSRGYMVFAGEKDGFGWLSGCIQKSGDIRILVYG